MRLPPLHRGLALAVASLTLCVSASCERPATDGGAELPPHVAAPGNSEAANPTKAVTWPRRMPLDPATGYVTSPQPKLRHAPRVIAWFPIGNSDTNPATRRIGWDIPAHGWANFVEKWAEPAIRLRFDAIQLHNPGGTKIGEEMQADQFLAAQEAGISWIARGFVDSWRPVTARIPVIAYMGMLPKNERLQGLLDRGDRAGFLRAVAKCYELPLDAHMDVAFDALHAVDERGWPLQVYRLMTSMGVRTYVETAPNFRDQSLYGANFEITLGTLERTLTLGESWMADPGELTGERIVLLSEPPTGKDWKTIDEWLGGWIHHWTSQGWSVAINPDGCIRNNVGPWELERVAAQKLGRPSSHVP